MPPETDRKPLRCAVRLSLAGSGRVPVGKRAGESFVKDSVPQALSWNYSNDSDQRNWAPDHN